MIPVSLLLILVAVTLLVLGLTGGSSNLLISSIVASLLAAVALVISARQTAAKRVAEEPAPEFAAPEFEPDPAPTYAAEPEFAEAARDTVQFEPIADPVAGDLSDDEAPVPTAADTAGSAGAASAPAASASAPAASAAEPEPVEEEFDEPDADDPDDEPLPQAVRPADAVRVARMDAEVLVVDGRPRYHLADCPHLVGKLTEPIPVNEAIELGFSPCGLCRPVDRLAAAAAHS
jgi:hypothetical protein